MKDVKKAATDAGFTLITKSQRDALKINKKDYYSFSFIYDDSILYGISSVLVAEIRVANYLKRLKTYQYLTVKERVTSFPSLVTNEKSFATSVFKIGCNDKFLNKTKKVIAKKAKSGDY